MEGATKENQMSGTKDEYNECFCLISLEPFSNSKTKEKWIQCIEYK